VFAATGVLALIGGGLLLTNSGSPHFQVARWLVALDAALVGAVVAAAAWLILRSRRWPLAVDARLLIGAEGLASSALDPDGLVQVAGESWKASATQPVAAGARVVVVGRAGLKLLVRPSEGTEAAAPLTAPRE
jgi:membrane-bound ClpP family serine protease